MKPLEILSVEEKAVLLHQLFPQNIPAFILFVDQMAITLQEEKEYHLLRRPFMSFQNWLLLTRKAQHAILTQKEAMQRDAAAFAATLFCTELAAFTVECLKIYNSIKRHEAKFSMAVNLLFN